MVSHRRRRPFACQLSPLSEAPLSVILVTPVRLELTISALKGRRLDQFDHGAVYAKTVAVLLSGGA